MLDFERLLKDAENGVLPALKFLGDIYLNGYEENDIKPDVNKAIECYEKASDRGMEDTLLDLGYIYCSGKYMKPNYEKGLVYYERAAALGNTTALGNLGMCYCQGIGVKKDAKKGFEYFMKAAKGGHPLAMQQVSDMYYNGMGVEKSKELAEYWHKRAEEQKEQERLKEEQVKAREQQKPSNLEETFEKNLKFISNDTMNVDFVKKIFDDSSDGSFPNLRQFTMGECEFKTGKVITSDPLFYLKNPKEVFIKEKSIAPGKYPIQVAVLDSDVAGRRIVGARLKVNEKEAVRYELAKCLMEKDGEFKTTYAGFPVECGMGCFCDEQAAKSYWNFLSKWYQEHENGNIYDDYFASLFAESYQKAPEYQREGGDLLMWNNPIDNSQIAMFASGLGDGYYTDFWGIDETGEVCELIVIFLNPEFC